MTAASLPDAQRSPCSCGVRSTVCGTVVAVQALKDQPAGHKQNSTAVSTCGYCRQRTEAAAKAAAPKAAAERRGHLLEGCATVSRALIVVKTKEDQRHHIDKVNRLERAAPE